MNPLALDVVHRIAPVVAEIWIQAEVWERAVRADVVSEQLISLTEVVIDACDALMHCKVTSRCARVVYRAGSVRQRHVRVDQLLRNGIDPALGNNIVWEDSTRSTERIANGRGGWGENSVTFGLYEYDSGSRGLRDGANALVTCEEEGPVLDNRTAYRPAELILFENALG